MICLFGKKLFLMIKIFAWCTLTPWDCWRCHLTVFQSWEFPNFALFIFLRARNTSVQWNLEIAFIDCGFWNANTMKNQVLVLSIVIRHNQPCCLLSLTFKMISLIGALRVSWWHYQTSGLRFESFLHSKCLTLNSNRNSNSFWTAHS